MLDCAAMTDAGNPSAVLRRERAQRAVARLSDEVGRWAAGWAGASAQTSQLQLVGKTLRERLLHHH